MSATAHSLPGQLTSDDLAILAPYGAKANWPAGFVLYECGSPANGLFIVLSGRIVLSNSGRNKRDFISWVAFERETLGCEGLSPEASYATNAYAAVQSETLHLNFDSFRALVREQPNCAIALSSQMVTERAAILVRLHDFAAASVDARVLAALDRLSHDPSSKANGTLVVSPSDYRLLCDMVGATRESISLALGRLVGSGVAERKGTSYVIHRNQLALSPA
ncbi:MAG TPA: Crp/Fnr family transcriptional regulator [Gemmatimonadaceae bacterium]|nr:Crp/Fnr family transcriptional regulator [Gemmatimonadaceae bacterium]